MKTIYYAEDGKKFEDRKECLAYEEKIAEEKKAAEEARAKTEATRKKKLEEKDACKKEVEEAYRAYKDLLNKYLDDYGIYSNKISNDSLDYDYPLVILLY